MEIGRTYNEHKASAYPSLPLDITLPSHPGSFPSYASTIPRFLFSNPADSRYLFSQPVQGDASSSTFSDPSSDPAVGEIVLVHLLRGLAA